MTALIKVSRSASPALHQTTPIISVTAQINARLHINCIACVQDSNTIMKQLFYDKNIFQLVQLPISIIEKNIVPGPVVYTCNKVVVAGADIKYQFFLKRCNIILFKWNKTAPAQV